MTNSGRRIRTRAETRARYFVRREAKQRNWNTAHVDRGGDLLEENEIVAHFPDIGLGLDKPDFMFCLQGNPVVVLETKNVADKIDVAIDEAIGYADTINEHGKYTVRLAVGVAGQDDTGYQIVVCFLAGRRWRPLRAYGVELTNIPTVSEVRSALEAGDGNTQVEIPSAHEFVDTAIEMSRVFRACKVEAPLRPRVIGALVLAMTRGEINTAPNESLASVNKLVSQAVEDTHELADDSRNRLKDVLTLSGADFERLASYIERAINTLRRLNVRAVMETDTDFLGTFYEAFLRYGYDNNALGIVFTPRHITRFCVDLTGISPSDRVVDIACGTGGFLVSAFDQMMKQVGNSPRGISKIKRSLNGFETNPTVWALSMLNMIFRGDGKSHIECRSCFDADNRNRVREKFTRAYLNPPFSQDDEPERDFIDASLDALEPDGTLAAVVKAGIFADGEHAGWRRELTRRHSPLAVISLPEDLFYPTAAPTSVLLVQAHRPLDSTDSVLMARVWNDGFEKLKGRRVAREGSQLLEIVQALQSVQRGDMLNTPLASVIPGELLIDGEELSPQEWLPQPTLASEQIDMLQNDVLASIIRAVALRDGLGNLVLSDFGSEWDDEPRLPYGVEAPLSTFFSVTSGKSIGEKHYSEGVLPYVSSGESANSIVRLVDADESEMFPAGGITVTAFGYAFLQPWPFVARGNGGSAVRVLTPRFSMSIRELIWFASQINSQRWRFLYSRMAIKSRLSRLVVSSPPDEIRDSGLNLPSRIGQFQQVFVDASSLQ